MTCSRARSNQDLTLNIQTLMKPRFPFPLVVLCGILTANCGAPGADPIKDRVQGWRSDVDFLLGAIQREHYVYRAKPLPETTRRIANELKNSIASMSDER